MSRKRSLIDKLRGRLGGSLRSAGTFAEGSRAASLSNRLETGDVVWRAFVDAGAALRQRGRFSEADRMLERGLGAFPDDAILLYEHALSAHNSGRYALSVARWERAIASSAALPPARAAMCWSGLAANLRELGHLDRARATIAEARELFPRDLVVVSEAARIAESGGDPVSALLLWRTALRAPEPPLEWVQGEIIMLVRLGRLDEAAEALAAGRQRFTEPPGLLVAEGMLLSARGDWPAAAAAWSAYLDHVPDDAAVRERLAAAREAARSRSAAPLAAGLATAAELLRGFESIGESCEFAAVQRSCGAEADGLLSWSDLSLDALVAALGSRFDGLGDPSNVRLTAREGGECFIEDRRWSFAIRAAPPGDAVAAEGGDALLPKASRRIAALRDRLIADLVKAEKLFVFRSDSLDTDRLDLLHRALAAYGPVRLIAVQPAAPTAPTLLHGEAGEVVRIGEGRFVGFLDRCGDGPTVEDWVALCRRAAALA